MITKERTLKNVVLKITNSFKIILIIGMRQVGKTTFLKNIDTQNRKYVTLDNPRDLILAKDDPTFFLETYSPPILIDEI